MKGNISERDKELSGEMVLSNAETDMAIFEDLPEEVRYALNYSVHKYASIECMKALISGMTPAQVVAGIQSADDRYVKTNRTLNGI